MRKLNLTFKAQLWIPQGMDPQKILGQISPEHILLCHLSTWKTRECVIIEIQITLFEWQKQTVRDCHGSSFKNRLDGYTLTEVWHWFRYWPWRCCRRQDVSHILIDIQLITPTAHTWCVMRMEKYTISISGIGPFVSVCVCFRVCLFVSVFEAMAINATMQSTLK